MVGQLELLLESLPASTHMICSTACTLLQPEHWVKVAKSQENTWVCHLLYPLGRFSLVAAVCPPGSSLRPDSEPLSFFFSSNSFSLPFLLLTRPAPTPFLLGFRFPTAVPPSPDLCCPLSTIVRERFSSSSISTSSRYSGSNSSVDWMSGRSGMSLK